MDLSPTRTETVIGLDRPWLYNSHGTESLETVTLDIANGGFTLVNGQVPSGTPIKLHAASKLYRRVITTTGSEEVADGHTFDDVTVKSGATKVGASLFWHGQVVAAKVPGTFVVANRGKFIRYV